MDKEPIQRAIQIAGGLKPLASLLGLKHYQVIQHWRNSGRVPADHVLALERATNRKVTRHELRPDLYPDD